jgi:phage terminase small subunit
VALTAKQEAFKNAVLAGKSGYEAVCIAGYSHKTRATADVIASRLCRHPEVAAAIEKGRQAAAEAAKVKAQDVIDELECIAFSDILDLVDVCKGRQMTVKSLAKLPKNIRRTISEIIPTKDGLRIKFHSKLQALEMLGNWLRMWREQHSIINEDYVASLIDTFERLLDRYADADAARSIREELAAWIDNPQIEGKGD